MTIPPCPRNAWLLWRLQRTASSSSFRARQADLHEILGWTERARSLELVLLAEMTARPAIHRAMEWLAYIAVRGLLMPERFAPRTRGPLQFWGASLSFCDTVNLAAERVPEGRMNADDLARLWSGAATRQRGSLVGYGEVLRHASRILREQERSILSATIERPRVATANVVRSGSGSHESSAEGRL